ncbi:MAG TPA: hypothetical protein VFE33_18880, partial [Thermoanaerobaculia bacterium]|nr:hypothetical protein [Thermoanaerobaculia bacterium]
MRQSRPTLLVLLFLLVLATLALPGTAQAPPGADPLAGITVVPDLAARLARWKPVEMPFDDRNLTTRERELLDKLVEASRALEDVYWRQGDPADIPLYNALRQSKSERDQTVARMLWIHGSRYDLVDENRPFLGTAPMPPGRGLYPEGVIRKEIDDYVAAHPAEKARSWTSTRWWCGVETASRRCPTTSPTSRSWNAPPRPCARRPSSRTTRA